MNSANPEGADGLSVSTDVIAGPVLILAPPRSFTSVICAMLGQHPQLYGLPEVMLFGTETLTEWWERSARATFKWADGLVRVVAELYFGGQTESTVKLARGWLVRRAHFTTGYLLEELAGKVHPRILVDKSPNIVYRMESMQRAHRMFPQARFIHLLRHPRGYGESVMNYLLEKAKLGPIPTDHWMLRLASYDNPTSPRRELPAGKNHADPQHSWYALHMNICEFLNSVPDYQKMQVRGEDLLTEPDQGLREIASWLGLRTDSEAIAEMKHPERSPYAHYGPPGAGFGNDHLFLSSPALRSDRVVRHSLEGPLTWLEDDKGFLPEVKRLAMQVGYS